MATVSPDEFAEMVGATPQVIRRHCKAGMPGARKRGRFWRIDPEKAKAYLEDPANAPKLSRRMPVDLGGGKAEAKGTGRKKRGRGPGSKRPTAPPPSIDVGLDDPAPPAPNDPLEEQILALRPIIRALEATMAQKGTVSPSLGQLYKQLSSELREVVLLQRREKEADARLMDREEHRITVTTLARLVQQEGSALAANVPDAVIAALAEAGIEFDDPKTAIMLMQQVVRDQWEACLLRMAEWIRQARDGDLLG